MPDSFTQVRRTGCLGNFFNSVVGAGFGALLFVIAFPVIWFGEGRTNMAQVAAASVAAPAGRADPANEGALIAVTGAVEADPLGDAPYLRPGAYLSVERLAEMYAWVEHKETKTHDEAGGGTRSETTYTYRKEWTSSPQSGQGFEYPSGHRNPTMEFSSETLRASGGQVGAYGLDLAHLDLPSAKELRLSPAILATTSNLRLADNFLLVGDSSLSSPQLGDVRISYKALPAGQPLTVFGAQRGGRIEAYSTEKGDRLYRALEGDRAAAIKQLQIEDTITDWIIRGVALLMMWGGLSMTLGPINAAFGVLPVIRQAGGCLIGLITLAVAFPIWATTVLIAIVAHNIWLMIAVALLILGGAFLVLRQRRA
jgi:hypothetical protein